MVVSGQISSPGVQDIANQNLVARPDVGTGAGDETQRTDSANFLDDTLSEKEWYENTIEDSDSEFGDVTQSFEAECPYAETRLIETEGVLKGQWTNWLIR